MAQVRDLLHSLMEWERKIQSCTFSLDKVLVTITGIVNELNAKESESIRISQLFAVARKDSLACLDKLKNNRVPDLDSLSGELKVFNQRSSELFIQLEGVLGEFRVLIIWYRLFDYYFKCVAGYFLAYVTAFYLTRQQLEPYQTVRVHTLSEARFVRQFTNMNVDLDVVRVAHGIRIANGHANGHV